MNFEMTAAETRNRNYCRTARARSLLCLGLFYAAILPAPDRAGAVLFYRTGDPAYNTNAPEGVLTNSGWQFEGAWGIFTGTVISSNCFVSAQHVGGTNGQSFEFQSVSYTTVNHYDDTNGDLRIWRVSGQFPIHAQLYRAKDELGKPLVVIGRGTQRGAAVLVNNKVRGWQWGTWDSVQRWGVNRVVGVIHDGSGLGDLLEASFVAGAARNEADLSGGDSGGGVFIKAGAEYKLAGVNYAVTGPYNTTNSGEGFEAALFNQRGLYETNGTTGTWTFIPLRTGQIAGRFYVTRISSRIDWIDSVLSLPP